MLIRALNKDVVITGGFLSRSGEGVGEGEDEALCEGGIEAAMGGLGEPDEVGGTVVGGDAVEMVTIERMQMPIWDLGRRREPFNGSGSDESESNGMVNENVAIVSGHFVIDLLSPTVLFVLRSRCVLGSKRMVGAMMEGVQDSFGRGKKGVSAGS